MDKVLKRRLIGASILIALAVIFVPMLLVDPDSVGEGAGARVDVPPMPDSGGEVRRIPLDPDAARVAADEPRGTPEPAPESAPQSTDRPPRGDPPARPPDDEIVLRPELAEPEQRPDDDAPAAAGADDGGSGPAESESAPSAAEGAAAEREPTTAAAQPDAEPAPAGDFIVQVASFGSDDAADRIGARLEALGHSVARDEIVRGQTLLYRLRTGPYPSRPAAEQAREQIATTVQGVEPIVREYDAELRASAEPGFAVQVGSFVSADNAESETARLQELGFEALRFSERVGERTIWRVVVGPVDDRAEADTLKTRVGREAGVEGLVVSYP